MDIDVIIKVWEEYFCNYKTEKDVYVISNFK